MARPRVLGVNVDGETRCAHWHSAVDVVAIRMFCCGEYYACKDCHAELAGHPAQVWPRERWQEMAVLCGGCGEEMSVEEYLASGAECPQCGAGFNPRCSLHYGDYFAWSYGAGL